MIKAVIFDLGRVLVDIDFSQGLLGYLGLADKESLSRLVSDENFRDFSSGRIGADEFYRKSKERYSLTLSYSEFAALWCKIFSEKQGMRALVEQVKGKYSIGLLSDTDPLHWNHILKLVPWIEKCFAVPVLSYKINCMKPAEEAYLAAAASVGEEIEDCLFIDDLEQNIAGARQAGMQGIVFTGVDSLSKKLQDLGVL